MSNSIQGGYKVNGVFFLRPPERVFMNANNLPVLLRKRSNQNYWIYYWQEGKWEPQYATSIPPRVYPDNLTKDSQELYNVKILRQEN